MGAKKSDGQYLTEVDWRGYRLADAAAKAAVETFRLDKREEGRLRFAETMVQKAMVKLGQVTAAASDHRVVVEVDGAQVVQKVRDSEATSAEGGQV